MEMVLVKDFFFFFKSKQIGLRERFYSEQREGSDLRNLQVLKIQQQKKVYYYFLIKKDKQNF